MHVINFSDAGIAVLGFESKQDMLEVKAKMDYLLDNAESWPMFYVVTSPSTSQENIGKITKFLSAMKRMKVDLDTVRRNINAGRFEGIKGHGVGTKEVS